MGTSDDFMNLYDRANPDGHSPFDQPLKQEATAMSQTNEVDHTKSLEPFNSLLVTEGVLEAIKSGASVTIEWDAVVISNPKYNAETGGTDEDMNPLYDEREDLKSAVPRLHIKSREDAANDTVIQAFTAELGKTDKQLDRIEDRLSTVDRRTRAIEQFTEFNDDEAGGFDDDFAQKVADKVKVSRPRERSWMTVAMIAAWFILGSLYGASHPSDVAQAVNWVLSALPH